jgi:hypothetical protein
VLDKTFGVGPLEMLLKDQTISDIQNNGAPRRLARIIHGVMNNPV